MKIKTHLLLISLATFLSGQLWAQTGIGTTAPVNKFEVVTAAADPASSGATANGNLRIGATSTNVHVLDFGLSSTSTFSWLQARSKSAYGTTYNLSLNPIGGNVGIGTSAPSSTLTVGNTGGTIPGEITLNPAFSSNEGGQINFRKSLNGSTADWTIDQYGTSSSDARFRIFNSIAETNGLTILENGKIGMGLALPTTLLHIQNGNTAGSNDPANNTLPSIYLFNTNSSSTSANSILALRTTGSGGGSPFLSFDISGIRGYSMGMDNGDGDKFKIIPNWNFTGLNSPILTIDTDNKVGIGTASPARRLHVQSSDNTSVYIESSTIDNNGMVVLNGNTNQNWSNGWHEFLIFQREGITIGQVTAPSANSVAYTSTSDYRLKKDLKSFKGLELINRLKTYDFAWKTDDSRMYGFMAHELQDVLPYIVSGQKDVVDATGKIIPQTLDYSKLTPILVKAIQEQDETINSLKKDKERLEQTIKEIQERLLKLENKK